jgi:hypothetical protein
MKIFNIVIFDLKQPEQVISACLPMSVFVKNTYQQIIMEKVRPCCDIVLDKLGIHRLKIKNVFYYADIQPSKVAVIAIEQELTASAIKQLMLTIHKAQNEQQLAAIIANPEQALETAGMKIKKDLAQTKALAIDNLEKIYQRGEQLVPLSEKTDYLAEMANKMREESSKAKNRYRCPNWFFFFQYVKDLLPEYSYLSPRQSKAKK